MVKPKNSINLILWSLQIIIFFKDLFQYHSSPGLYQQSVLNAKNNPLPRIELQNIKKKIMGL